MPAEPHWLLILLFLGSGFVLLAKGADWLVGGSTQIARRLGVSTLAIGLTVVAWGTSAPELVVSAMAAGQGQSAIALGNVLGSNVANVGLVLGACGLVLPGVLHSRLAFRDAFWLVAPVLALWGILHDGGLSRLDAIGLLALFVVYNLWLWRTARTGGVVQLEVPSDVAHRRPYARALAGTVGVALGAWLAVEGAEAGALQLGVDERVVGLTVVAVGTSLPELAAGLGSAFKGETDISLGNVVGSNVFNVLAVLGLTGVVRPLEATAMPSADAAAELEAAVAGALATDLPVVLAFSLAALALPWLGRGRLGRTKALLLLAGYAGYTWTLFA